MKLPRRKLLGLGAVSMGAALLPGCKTLEQQLTKTSLPEDALPPASTGYLSPEAQVLNRAAYGPRPGDVARIQRLGIPAYVEEQLHPDNIEEEPAATWRVRALGDVLNHDMGILLDEDDRLLVQAMRQAALLRAVYSRRQLNERMVEFWTDHFNIYAFKGQGPQLKVLDDQQTIRAHSLGKFRDLLGASARSAAMLGYLDNIVNRKGVPNENYARELMELHTLGVDGGYTQHDVKEVARCLTGWTMDKGLHKGRFTFDPSLHDDGEKVVLGHRIASGGGIEDGEKVLDIAASHPSTACHLARKVCIYFLGEASNTWVERLQSIYLQTGGDIRALLQPLLTSPDLLNAKPILKRPFDYVVSSLRALNVDTDGGRGVQGHLEKMGQALFAWPMPDGFPQRASAWTGTLIPRWNFAMGLTSNGIENTSIDWDALTQTGKSAGLSPHDSLVELTFGCRAHDTAISRLCDYARTYPDYAEFTALLLMSPEFQWK